MAAGVNADIRLEIVVGGIGVVGARSGIRAGDGDGIGRRTGDLDHAVVDDVAGEEHGVEGTEHPGLRKPRVVQEVSLGHGQNIVEGAPLAVLVRRRLGGGRGPCR